MKKILFKVIVTVFVVSSFFGNTYGQNIQEDPFFKEIIEMNIKNEFEIPEWWDKNTPEETPIKIFTIKNDTLHMKVSFGDLESMGWLIPEISISSISQITFFDKGLKTEFKFNKGILYEKISFGKDGRFLADTVYLNDTEIATSMINITNIKDKEYLFELEHEVKNFIQNYSNDLVVIGRDEDFYKNINVKDSSDYAEALYNNIYPRLGSLDQTAEQAEKIKNEIAYFQRSGTFFPLLSMIDEESPKGILYMMDATNLTPWKSFSSLSTNEYFQIQKNAEFYYVFMNLHEFGHFLFLERQKDFEKNPNDSIRHPLDESAADLYAEILTYKFYKNSKNSFENFKVIHHIRNNQFLEYSEKLGYNFYLYFTMPFIEQGIQNLKENNSENIHSTFDYAWYNTMDKYPGLKDISSENGYRITSTPSDLNQFIENIKIPDEKFNVEGQKENPLVNLTKTIESIYYQK